MEILYYLSALMLGIIVGVAVNKLTRPIYDKVRRYLLPDWYLDDALRRGVDQRKRGN